MKIYNNYILLLKGESEKITSSNFNPDDKSIVIETPVNFIDLLNEIFKLEHIDWNIISKFFRHTVSFEFSIDSIESKVAFEVFSVQGNYYFNVEVFSNTKFQCVKVLEVINSKLFDKANKIEKQFIIILTYDAVSDYYCNKIFSKFSHFERLFRRLLFNIYILNYGRKYYEKTIPKEITDKAKGNIRAKKNKEEQYLKEYFYSLDYSDLQALLFTKNWTSVDDDNISDFLKTHDNLLLMSDERLRKFIQAIGAKSDWDRLFKSKVDVTSIEKDIDYIRKQRNKVAHSKIFTYEDYKESLKTLNKVEKTINEAIKYTQDKDFSDKNIEVLRNRIEAMSKTIREFSEKIISPIKQIQLQVSETIDPISRTMSGFRQTMEPIYKSLNDYILMMSNDNATLDENNGEDD